MDKLNPRLRQIIHNISWLFAEKIVILGMSLVVGVLTARYFGPQQYGIYNYSLSFIMLFQPLAQLGLQPIIIRDSVQDVQGKDSLLGTAFILKVLGSSLALILSLVSIILLRPNQNVTQILVGIFSVITVIQSWDIIDYWFQSQVQSKYTVICRLIAVMSSSIIKIVMIQLEISLILFTLVSLIEAFILYIGLLWSYLLSGESLKKWTFKLSQAYHLLNESWPQMLASFSILIQARIDQVMLGQMINDYEVGQYSVAMKLIEVFNFVPVIVIQSLAPSIANAKLTNQILYLNRLENTYRLMWLSFIILALPIILFAKPMVILIFGQDYTLAGQLMSLFFIRLFFASFGIARSLYITNEGFFKYSLITAVVGSLINIGFNYPWIPDHASYGALWATILSFAVTIFILDLFIAKMRVNLKLMGKAILFPWQLKLNFH